MPIKSLGIHTSAKFRQKRLRPDASDMIVFDVGLLEAGREEELREAYRAAPVKKRQKMVVALFAVYGAAEIARRLGTSVKAVNRARKRYPDIETGALLARNMSIADLCERKIIKLVSSIDVGKIDDKEKAKSAKLLSDVADLQYGQMGQAKRGEEEATEELIYRVRRRVVKKVGEDDGERNGNGDDAIDITGEVKDANPT